VLFSAVFLLPGCVVEPAPADDSTSSETSGDGDGDGDGDADLDDYAVPLEVDTQQPVVKPNTSARSRATVATFAS